MPVGDVQFRILGSLELERAGRPVDLGSHKQKALLALMLLHSNQIVSSDRILDELWGEDAVSRQGALSGFTGRISGQRWNPIGHLDQRARSS